MKARGWTVRSDGDRPASSLIAEDKQKPYLRTFCDVNTEKYTLSFFSSLDWEQNYGCNYVSLQLSVKSSVKSHL